MSPCFSHVVGVQPFVVPFPPCIRHHLQFARIRLGTGQQTCAASQPNHPADRQATYPCQASRPVPGQRARRPDILLHCSRSIWYTRATNQLSSGIGQDHNLAPPHFVLCVDPQPCLTCFETCVAERCNNTANKFASDIGQCHNSTPPHVSPFVGVEPCSTVSDTYMTEPPTT